MVARQYSGFSEMSKSTYPDKTSEREMFEMSDAECIYRMEGGGESGSVFSEHSATSDDLLPAGHLSASSGEWESHSSGSEENVWHAHVQGGGGKVLPAKTSGGRKSLLCKLALVAALLLVGLIVALIVCVVLCFDTDVFGNTRGSSAAAGTKGSGADPYLPTSAGTTTTPEGGDPAGYPGSSGRLPDNTPPSSSGTSTSTQTVTGPPTSDTTSTTSTGSGVTPIPGTGTTSTTATPTEHSSTSSTTGTGTGTSSGTTKPVSSSTSTTTKSKRGGAMATGWWVLIGASALAVLSSIFYVVKRGPTEVLKSIRSLLGSKEAAPVDQQTGGDLSSFVAPESYHGPPTTGTTLQAVVEEVASHSPPPSSLSGEASQSASVLENMGVGSNGLSPTAERLTTLNPIDLPHEETLTSRDNSVDLRAERQSLEPLSDSAAMAMDRVGSHAGVRINIQMREQMATHVSADRQLRAANEMEKPFLV